MVNLTNKFLDLVFEQAKINLGSTKQNPSPRVEKDGAVIRQVILQKVAHTLNLMH